MKIDVITAFPAILRDPLNESILKQGQRRTALEIALHDLREFATDKHRTLDDTPYGGGPGMVMKVEPLFAALEAIADTPGRRVIFPSPQGRLFTQDVAAELAEEEHLIFVCGHYKAVDQRVIDTWVDDEISVGDFILSGGEIPTLMMVDGIVRLIPGVINHPGSAESDSFQDGLLDCSYYTRPEVFRDMRVPDVLLSGNHQKIAEWRMAEKLARTRERRPDLYEEHKKKNQKT
ncbi:MAG: tRNA (guanosine(37)-N1)-methyltransferase TrmD [Calditrichaeota bacterium]|nr:tRNA (guanosine(37)-N1)-methyltransferase TrmD [Calditrichota bacterium]